MDARDRIALHAEAEERVAQLGPRPYPVLICGECARITGWLGSDGACRSCWAQRRAHESNSFAPAAVPVQAPPPGPLFDRFKRGGRTRAWLRFVDPDRTGPIEPEDGWDLEIPLKDDVPAPEGSHRIVRFDSQSMRFENGAWRPCALSRGGKPALLVPREFPASLPIEQLAEAWNDFEQELVEHNAAVWQVEAERRGVGTPPDDDERGTAALLG